MPAATDSRSASISLSCSWKPDSPDDHRAREVEQISADRPVGVDPQESARHPAAWWSIRRARRRSGPERDGPLARGHDDVVNGAALAHHALDERGRHLRPRGTRHRRLERGGHRLRAEPARSPQQALLGRALSCGGALRPGRRPASARVFGAPPTTRTAPRRRRARPRGRRPRAQRRRRRDRPRRRPRRRPPTTAAPRTRRPQSRDRPQARPQRRAPRRASASGRSGTNGWEVASPVSQSASAIPIMTPAAARERHQARPGRAPRPPPARGSGAADTPPAPAL